MKLSRMLCLLLVAVMLFCNVPAFAMIEESAALIPSDEYERGVWYGFLTDDLKDADPDETVITWKQYCTMIGQMIARYRLSDLSEWNELTKGMPDQPMMRDGAMIALFFGARAVGLDYYTTGNFPPVEYDWGNNCSWDYPVFEWNQPVQMLNWEEEPHYIWPTYCFAFGMRVSCVTGQQLMDFENGTPSLNTPLMLRTAVVSLVRLYESDQNVAYDYACAMLDQIIDTPASQDIIRAAEERKQQILNSETTIVKSDQYIQGETYTGTAYYISNQGDDRADGKSPETAWATIERLAESEFTFGDAIFFERGGLWREAALPSNVLSTQGLTFSAYGEGEKPKLYGSPENGAGAEKWSLYHEGANGEKIWKFHREMPETSVMVMDGGSTYAKRDVPFWTGSKYVVMTDFSQDYAVENQLKDMEFFPWLDYGDKEYGAGITAIYVDGHENGFETFVMGPLYLRCDAGNPGKVFSSIEFATVHALGDGLPEYTTLDNLNHSFGKPACGGGTDGSPNDHIYMQNCEMSWGAGQISYYTKADDPYGANMGYVWSDKGFGNVSGNYSCVRNNYFHHAFQEGVSFETFTDVYDPVKDIFLVGNLTEYCTMGLLLVNWDMEYKEPHIFSNVSVRDNMVLFAGFENFYHTETKPTTEELWGGAIGNRVRDTHALSFGDGLNAHDGTVSVTGNTFAFSASQLIAMNNYTEEYSHILNGNTYAQLPGMMWLCKIDFTPDFSAPDEFYTDADVAIKQWVQDQNATIITFND